MNRRTSSTDSFCIFIEFGFLLSLSLAFITMAVFFVFVATSENLYIRSNILILLLSLLLILG